MKVGEHIHIFATSACNLGCAYCFGPDASYRESRLPEVAEKLAAKGVRMATIGGGEPLLAEGLYDSLKILKKKDVYVSLHTNGTLLTKQKIKELSGLVDDIGLPLDALDERTQISLRGEGFRKTFRRIFEVAAEIRANGIGVGWHTVFVNNNFEIIPEVYDRIIKEPFKYWRIYEYNLDLATWKHIKVRAEIESEKELKKLIKNIRKAESIDGSGTADKGYIDCILAQFVLMNHYMDKHNDKRMQFVARKGYQQPYIFVEPDGEMRYYAWYSDRERKSAGNIFSNKWSSMIKSIQRINDHPWEKEETLDEWNGALWDMPLWARLWEGTYFPEELDEIKGEYWEAFLQLAEMFTCRNLMLEGVSKTKAIADAKKMVNLFS